MVGVGFAVGPPEVEWLEVRQPGGEQAGDVGQGNVLAVGDLARDRIGEILPERQAVQGLREQDYFRAGRADGFARVRVCASAR